jgi:hypothetical protein
MNRVGKAALGCFLFPIGLGVIGLMIFLGAKAVGVPDSRSAQTELTQAIEGDASDAATALARNPQSDSAIEVQPGMVVILEMEEGKFTVEPGPVEDGIRVEAEYDEATYRLEKNYDVEGETPIFHLRFKSTVSLLRRLAQGGFDDEDMENNDIVVTLPEGVPIKLVMILKKSESEINLDGIALTDLVTKFRMGEYSIVSQTLNPILMREFKGDFAMGEFEVEGMANFRARQLTVSGQMGETLLDFRESLSRDTVMDVRWRMGEVNLRVPSDAFWDPSSSFTATMGEVSNGRRKASTDFDPEFAKRLRVDASILMGELKVQENRKRGAVLR